MSSYLRHKKTEVTNVTDFQSALLKAIFALRYEVYCLERRFLRAEEFQNGLESDEYDACSTHFATFTPDDTILGTVRLVQPDDEMPYPFQNHCRIFDDFVMPAREHISEVSRLVVKNTHRRRGNLMSAVAESFLNKDQDFAIKPQHENDMSNEISPMLLLGLFREMYRHSQQRGIRYWFAAMERPLARSLAKMGFRPVPIGPQSDYYGPVIPYMVDLEEHYGRLAEENKLLFAWFDAQPNVW
ncbi:MAG: PEP-CTERM/exosortase system-associated acyltransferase [Pseudomonadota bacterium]